MGGTDVHVDIRKHGLDRSTFRVLEQAGAVTFFSAEAKQVIETLRPVWKEKLHVVPQGVLLPKKTFPAEPLGKVKETSVNQKKLNIVQKEAQRKRKFHILFPTGLRDVKDVLHLLPAWKSLARELEGFQVTIIGEALDPNIFQKVQETCRDHSFITYHDAVPFEEMGRFYEQADLVINTSKEEGQPTAICEAMALGIPVIARSNAGNRSVIEHGRTGFLYESPMQFVDYVHILRNDAQLRERMKRAARHFILTERSVAQEIESYLFLFAKLIF